MKNLGSECSYFAHCSCVSLPLARSCMKRTLNSVARKVGLLATNHWSKSLRTLGTRSLSSDITLSVNNRAKYFKPKVVKSPEFLEKFNEIINLYHNNYSIIYFSFNAEHFHLISTRISISAYIKRHVISTFSSQ